MFLSRVMPDLHKTPPSRLARVGADDYRIHQELWRLFEEDEDAQRDFLYRREDSNTGFLVLSARKPVNEGIWSIETKPFHPQIKAGDRFAFDLRANPVRKKRDSQNRQQRHDVVMERKRQYGARSEIAPSQAAIEREAGLEWLLSRAEQNGFEVQPDTVIVEGYRQHRFFQKKIVFSTLDFKGLLRVTDPDRFMEALQYGVGPSKAFGCGLLLIRRV